MVSKIAQSMVNTLLSFSQHSRLPLKQGDPLKTPQITALGTYV